MTQEDRHYLNCTYLHNASPRNMMNSILNCPGRMSWRDCSAGIFFLRVKGFFALALWSSFQCFLAPIENPWYFLQCFVIDPFAPLNVHCVSVFGLYSGTSIKYPFASALWHVGHKSLLHSLHWDIQIVQRPLTAAICTDSSKKSWFLTSYWKNRWFLIPPRFFKKTDSVIYGMKSTLEIYAPNRGSDGNWSSILRESSYYAKKRLVRVKSEILWYNTRRLRIWTRDAGELNTLAYKNTQNEYVD